MSDETKKDETPAPKPIRRFRIALNVVLEYVDQRRAVKEVESLLSGRTARITRHKAFEALEGYERSMMNALPRRRPATRDASCRTRYHGTYSGMDVRLHTKLTREDILAKARPTCDF